MTRALRIDIANGWYHITNRGIDRRRIYDDDRDYRHFLELLGMMSERCVVRVHAYALMTNHYHLVMQTPEANASRAMQWLNVSYAAWYNRRHQRVGPLFQGRFKSVLIDGQGGWVSEVCEYVHLNPIRVAVFGLGKRDRKIETKAMAAPMLEQIQQRLETLRGYRWSSYRAYAGYSRKEPWLVTADLLKRSGGQNRIRTDLERYVKQGMEENPMKKMKAGLVLGSESFLESIRQRVKKVTREQPGRRVLNRFVSWEDIVSEVEKICGGEWAEFRDVYGHVGRDMALYIACLRSGLTLAEIGVKAGGLDYKAVGKAVSRFSSRLKRNRNLRNQTHSCLSQLSIVET